MISFGVEGASKISVALMKVLCDVVIDRSSALLTSSLTTFPLDFVHFRSDQVRRRCFLVCQSIMKIIELRVSCVSFSMSTDWPSRRLSDALINVDSNFFFFATTHCRLLRRSFRWVHSNAEARQCIRSPQAPGCGRQTGRTKYG